MILNRLFEIAEGVRLYNVESWKIINEDKGKECVLKYAEEVCNYYISQRKDQTYGVREAAAIVF